MTKLRWTIQAIEDVEAIRKFIANDSDAYADLVVARLLEAVERLEQFPRSGRVVPELADPQLREIIESPYRIVYRVLDESIEILTVFRASRLFRNRRMWRPRSSRRSAVPWDATSAPHRPCSGEKAGLSISIIPAMNYTKSCAKLKKN